MIAAARSGGRWLDADGRFHVLPQELHSTTVAYCAAVAANVADVLIVEGDELIRAIVAGKEPPHTLTLRAAVIGPKQELPRAELPTQDEIADDSPDSTEVP